MSVVTVGTTPYVLGAGKTLTAVDQNAIDLVAPDVYSAWPRDPGSVTISGRVDVSGAGSPSNHFYLEAVFVDLGFADHDTLLRVTSTGSIKVATTATMGTAVGIAADDYAPQIVNDGTISATSPWYAYGIRYLEHLGGQGVAVTNTGTISVNAGGVAIGVQMYDGEPLSNSGLIEANGAYEAEGVYFDQHAGSLTNTGVIRAHLTGDGDSQSIAVNFRASLVSFVNSGTLEGDIALKFSGSASPTTWPPHPATLQNTGQMIGSVVLSDNMDNFINSGAIRGTVNLSSGDDTYSGGGTTTGMVSGGDGADSLSGGAGFDNFQGNAGADTEHGNGGADWVVGGRDNDLLYGDDGDDIVYGNIGNDTCDGGAGADTIRGGQNEDSLSGGAGNDWLSGDLGNDTISGGAGADTFHISKGAGVDRVMDFNLGEGDRVQLDAGMTYTVAQSGADTILDLGGGDQVILVGVQASSLTGSWIFNA